MSAQYYGWYSLASAQPFGTKVWRRADGSEVHLTLACRSADEHGTGWTDMHYVGPIEEYVRKGVGSSRLVFSSSITELGLSVALDGERRRQLIAE